MSSFTINDTINILLIILKTAYKKKYIQTIPEIKKVVLPGNKRGCLTSDEVKAIFSLEWENHIAYVGNLIAASTGLREGEIVAIQYKSVFPNYIHVVQSWNLKTHTLKAPKNGKGRVVPLASRVYEEIMRLKNSAIWQGEEAFVFQSEKPDKPMNPELLRDELYKMFDKIGIDETERVNRQLCFHSWRHFLNSLLLNGNINKFKVQSLIGHQSDEMSLNYYHSDDYADVLKLQDSLFRQ